MPISVDSESTQCQHVPFPPLANQALQQHALQHFLGNLQELCTDAFNGMGYFCNENGALTPVDPPTFLYSNAGSQPYKTACLANCICVPEYEWDPDFGEDHAACASDGGPTDPGDNDDDDNDDASSSEPAPQRPCVPSGSLSPNPFDSDITCNGLMFGFPINEDCEKAVGFLTTSRLGYGHNRFEHTEFVEDGASLTDEDPDATVLLPYSHTNGELK
ncbi:uncharacterized protein KY384_002913 [Bacidia gigantensis]|uniref:uncharacterized protein n=1 Tax=Bacidia gigantensis TaxID=2732470 RepID=UPI001D057AA3|nr:uncharacterized protein KY384_002913 [Bacidia gigantensis]KAG8532428.1 hypothetical protein KY384_002913 [Bacidia gigantensis]